MGINSVDFIYVPNLLYIDQWAFADNNISKLDFTNNKKVKFSNCTFMGNPLEIKNIQGISNDLKEDIIYYCR